MTKVYLHKGFDVPFVLFNNNEFYWLDGYVDAPVSTYTGGKMLELSSEIEGDYVAILTSYYLQGVIPNSDYFKQLLRLDEKEISSS